MLTPSPLVFALLLGGAAAATAQETPVFRSGVELVTVDATVINPDGQPDPALGPDDFQLKVDGKVRRVVSAQFVSLVASEAPPPPVTARHFSSNEFSDPGRLVVIAVDEPHIRRTEGRAAMRAAAGFLERLDPLDRVAVIGLSQLGTLEFSRDRAALSRRLEMLTGQGDPVFLQFNIGLAEAVEIADGGRARLADVVLRECGRSLTEYLNPARAVEDAGAGRDACPEQVEQEARAVAQHARTQARISLSALEALVEALQEFDRPKTLVLLTEGLVADPRLMDFSEFSIAAQEARVSIYVLQMEQPLFEAATDRVSPTFLHDVRMRGDGLTRLAGSARGAVFRLLGGDPAPFQRIATELSGHYLIAFEPLPSDRDGRLHRLELSVERRRATVRARQSFRMAATIPSARAREQALVALLRSDRPATELPVRIATYSSVDAGSSDLRVVVSTEAEAGGGSRSEVLLGYVLIDRHGTIISSGAQRADAGRHAFSATVPAGAYTLRVGGIDVLGRRGLVQRSFAAAITPQNGIRVSDVILAPVPTRPRAPLHPVVDRIDDAEALGYIELSLPEGHLGELEVSFDVLSDDSVSPHMSIQAAVVRRGDRWATARAVLPLGSLAARRYIAVARVTLAGRELARSARPFTISRN